MSSSPPAERPRRAWRLRTRLVFGFVLIILVASSLAGLVTRLALGEYLRNQVDEQVRSLADRPDAGHGPGASGTVTCQATRTGPGPQDGALVAQLGAAPVGSVTERFRCTDLTATQLAALAHLEAGDRRPATVSVPGLGTFRALRSDSGQVVAVSTRAADATRDRLAGVLVASTGVAVLLGGLVVGLLVRRELRPLDRVAGAARAVAAMPLDRGEVNLDVRVPAADTDPRTEVGQVGAALDQMIRHVETALVARHEEEQRVRRFVADASHELRTPLAAVRGYAELASRPGVEEATIRHALGRVSSESVRMTGLVEDLLLLARLDSGRPLEAAPVDLTAAVLDAVGDARLLGPDHRWRLDLPHEPVLVTGDDARLRQVLVNLLANARVHTPPGTTVTATLRVRPGHVTIEVADDGPGVAPELLGEIFGRFVRGDASRARAAGAVSAASSTGLGLAIVAAVVRAHGGEVTVQSPPPGAEGGTLFTVRLPAPDGA